jgi:hypothetical protein
LAFPKGFAFAPLPFANLALEPFAFAALAGFFAPITFAIRSVPL